jgi:DNA-directed RNA polymerase specialized sigma24 family protein
MMRSLALLSAPWKLHDVADVEALLVTAVARSRAARGLRPIEREDLLAELFRLAWQLSERYHGDDHRRFSTFLYAAAQRRTVDFVRSERGRTRWKSGDYVYERQLPELVSLDDRLDDDHPGGNVDSSADRSQDLARLLNTRSSSRPRLADLGDRRSARAAA